MLVKLDQRAAEKVAQAAATLEIDDAGPMPTIAPRKERQPGPPSDRQPPRRLAPGKKWACKSSTSSSTTEHWQRMREIACMNGAPRASWINSDDSDNVSLIKSYMIKQYKYLGTWLVFGQVF